MSKKTYPKNSQNIITNAAKKTALITGGSKRIGKEIAHFLAQNNYDIVIHYNNSAKEARDLLKDLKTRYKIDGAVIQADLTQKNSTQKICDFMVKNFSSWSLLINNASTFQRSNFLSDIDSQFESNLSIHLTSPLKLCHYFANHVIKNNIIDAHIINLLDKNIVRFDTQNFYYLLTKKFLAELTKMLALQLAPSLRVNGIAIGYVLNDYNIPNAEEYSRNIAKKIPLQKMGNPKNVVQTLEFLLKNDFINGEIIYVDGGASLNHAG